MRAILLAFFLTLTGCATVPSDPIKRGEAVYQRHQAAKPYPASAPRQIDKAIAFFDADFDGLQAYLASLPAPATLGAELERRTVLEQFGRAVIVVRGPRNLGGHEEQFYDAVWGKVTPVDEANTARVKALLASREWFDDSKDGKGAEAYGWLIVQHSDADPDFQRLVLARMEEARKHRNIRMANYALLWDRVAVKDKRPQRYGTQVTCKNGEWEAIGGVEDRAGLDARRVDVGLTSWADYVKGISAFLC